MARANKRPKLLQATHRRPHRYRWIRALTLTTSFSVLLMIPLLDVARIDLWGGEHFFFRKPVSLGYGVFAVILCLAGLYVATFLVNLVAGRLFCGWGCPVHQLSRFGDRIDGQRTRAGKLRSYAGSVGFSMLLAVAVLIWLVDPAVVVEGSPTALGAVAGGFAAITLAGVLHGKYWRWSFCQKICPIGLYYSVVQTDRSFGIVFDDRAQVCNNCRLCDEICPAGLHPRELDAPHDKVGGLAFEGLPSTNHCLRCGDCIDVCELTTEKRSSEAAPMRFAVGYRGAPEPKKKDERASELSSSSQEVSDSASSTRHRSPG